MTVLHIFHSFLCDLTTQSEGVAGFSHVQLSDDLTGVHALITFVHISYYQVWSCKCVSEDKRSSLLSSLLSSSFLLSYICYHNHCCNCLFM